MTGKMRYMAASMAAVMALTLATGYPVAAKTVTEDSETADAARKERQERDRSSSGL